MSGKCEMGTKLPDDGPCPRCGARSDQNCGPWVTSITARAEAAEARCARLATALHKAREVRKGLVYWAEQFLIYEDGKRAWRLLKEMEDAISDAAQQETGDGD